MTSHDVVISTANLSEYSESVPIVLRTCEVIYKVSNRQGTVSEEQNREVSPLTHINTTEYRRRKEGKINGT